MDSIIEDTVSDDEIARLAQLYEETKQIGGEVESQSRFNYAYALLRSSHEQDIQKGITMFENLYQAGDSSTRRDSVYYVAIGHTRLKKYKLALDCVETFLKNEPNNHQAQRLREEIKHRLTQDGLRGIAIASGAAIVIGGLISLGISLAKKWDSLQEIQIVQCVYKIRM